MQKIEIDCIAINNIDELSVILELPKNELCLLASSADEFYRPNKPKTKKNGGVRQTYTVLSPLKEIHLKILKRIFNKIEFPSYLNGSIKDEKNPRDYILDAKIHSNKCIVIEEDIKNFFSSISSKKVYDIWHRLFNFSEDVSDILTKLTTYKGFVAQGAATSSSIANLVLWENEPNLVDELCAMGFTYTRYVDDIHLSSDKRKSKGQIRLAVNKVYTMILAYGFIPKRNKHKVTTSGKSIIMYGLSVNKQKPTLCKQERSKIRAAVYEIENLSPNCDKSSADYQKKYQIVFGRVNNLRRFNENEGDRLLARLSLCSPENKSY